MIHTNTRTELDHHQQWAHTNQFNPSGSVPGTSAESLGKGDRAVVIGRLKTRAWETPEGERRSTVEVEADEVGPSLRWATAKPQRAAKPNGKARDGFNDDPPF